LRKRCDSVSSACPVRGAQSNAQKAAAASSRGMIPAVKLIESSRLSLHRIIHMLTSRFAAALAALAATLLTSLPAVTRAEPQQDLLNIYATLASKRFIDLTHTFGVDTPHWKGFGEMKVRTLYTIKKDGFHVEEFCHVGQWGTHVD